MIKRFFTSLLFVLCAFAAFSQPAAQTASASAQQALLRNARTLYVHSNTAFLINDTLDRALMQQKEWNDLGLVIVGEPGRADLSLEVDRQIFTHIHTFVLSDRRTTIVLGSGRKRAFDGTLASGGIAKEVVRILATAKLSTAAAEL